MLAITLLKFCKCFKTNCYILGITSLFPYLDNGLFILTLSRNSIACDGMWFWSIFVIIFWNCEIEFVAPWGNVVCLISFCGVIIVIISLQRLFNSTWLYPEKKSIKDTILHLANSSENLLIDSRTLAFRIITTFILIIPLIS